MTIAPADKPSTDGTQADGPGEKGRPELLTDTEKVKERRKRLARYRDVRASVEELDRLCNQMRTLVYKVRLFLTE